MKKCYIEGIYEFELIFGKIKVFGYQFQDSDLDLESNESLHLFYSHQSTGIFLFENVEKPDIDIIEKSYDTYDNKQKLIFKYLNKNLENINLFSSAVVLKKSELISLKLYMQTCKKLIGLDKNYPINVYSCHSNETTIERFQNGFLSINKWESIGYKLLQILNSPENRTEQRFMTFLTCGQKSAGKSTLNRFISNFLFLRNYQVFWLDCDIGQSEIMPLGCVSLFKLLNPIFGPPFSHIYPNYNLNQFSLM